MRRPALSPSRASDFKQCPLLYRFRAIDRLPEPSSTAQVRGSVVHAALEQLYALPAASRDPATAMTLVDPAWERITAEKPELAAEFEPELRAELLEQARKLLSGYYRLEDPTRFDPQSCEQRVEVELSDGTLLRGFVDRIDVAPTGEMRVVDYKTGKAPPAARELAEAKAMFQMKFYAVALLRSRGVLPARLRLLYLADGQVLDYTPDLEELLRFEKTLMAMWRAIQAAGVTGDFRPKPSRLCDWCAHHQHCPVFGGTPPPYPGWPQAGGAGCVIDRYYRRLPDDGRFQVFESTIGTASNWDDTIQHGSPPLALMTKAIEELVGGFRAAGRSAGAGHPGRHSRCAGEGSGLGGTARHPHLDGGGRDARHPAGRHRQGGGAGELLAAGHQRHRRRGHRPLSPARRGRGRAECARVGRSDGLCGDRQLAHPGDGAWRGRRGVAEPRSSPWSTTSR